VTVRLSALEDRVVPTLLGNLLFPANHAWNENISAAPVAANSAAILNNVISRYGDGHLHPDFGQDYGTGDLYGIPYNVVHGNSTPRVAFVIDAYADESDVVPAPVPANAVIEGDFQNGPNPGVDNRGDSHLLIYDVYNNVAYEFGRASRPSENVDGRWHADQETVWDMKTNDTRTLGWTSADAAGLSILAGLVRPDEGLPVSQGGQGVINHAIRFTLQNSIILDQYIYPASHIANSGSNAAVQPPMGARFRLKAGVDISQLNPQSRIIAQAMKDYGMIVADNGSNFFFSGASYAVDASNNRTLTWDDNDIQDTVHGLKSLTFSDFEVVDLTPVVTDLSTHSAAAGTSLTIVGQNFGGANGHLQVLFGSTPATSVNIIDDSHIAVVVPAGGGTVDVRVQSGVNVGADPENYTSPIFGYGISALAAGDRFTYGTGSGPPAAITVTGTDAGGGPHVRVFDASNGALVYEFFAYDSAFRGGVRVALGDVTGDGVPDIITAPGVGGGPDIRVWDGVTHAKIRDFMAYDSSFRGGVYVAAGDVNGDGKADIITGPDTGGGPNVKVFSGADGSILQNFLAYSVSFTGGTRVAAGDVNGDGKADIVVGAGVGGGPHVEVFDGTNRNVLYSFMAFDPALRNGVYVAAGDIDGDSRADLVVAAGPGGGPHVKVYSGADLALLKSWMAYETSFTGGVRVAIVPDVSGDGLADIVTVPGPGGGPYTKVWSGVGSLIVDRFFAYDPAFLGGIFVGGV
jgi:hypothetical protein